jgi:preprotein translocase subunit SecY
MSIKLATQQAGAGLPVVPDAGPLFVLSTVFLLTAGVIFMMWLGEQITDKGLGNGISLIIMIGIIARFPDAIWQE